MEAANPIQMGLDGYEFCRLSGSLSLRLTHRFGGDLQGTAVEQTAGAGTLGSCCRGVIGVTGYRAPAVRRYVGCWRLWKVRAYTQPPVSGVGGDTCFHMSRLGGGESMDSEIKLEQDTISGVKGHPGLVLVV